MYELCKANKYFFQVPTCTYVVFVYKTESHADVTALEKNLNYKVEFNNIIMLIIKFTLQLPNRPNTVVR